MEGLFDNFPLSIRIFKQLRERGSIFERVEIVFVSYDETKLYEFF